MRISILGILLLLTYAHSFGQSNRIEEIGEIHVSNYKSWELSTNIGYSSFRGDFSSKGDDKFRVGTSFSLTKYFNSFWGVRARTTFSGISGADNPSWFSGSYRDWSVMATMNLNSLIVGGVLKERRFATIIGLGVGKSNAKLKYFQYPTSIEIPSENESATQWIIPLELRLKYRLNNNIDIEIGAEWKFQRSDALDGIVYGAQNDFIRYTYVGVAYNLGTPDKKSVVFTNPLEEIYFGANDFPKDLSIDSDRDGVSDYFDKDSSTPEGYAVDGSGVALDVDGDGIPDSIDENPFTPIGAKVDASGRSVDSDGDNVPDYMDKENNTPAGARVDWQGVSLPSGSIGFADDKLEEIPLFEASDSKELSSDLFNSDSNYGEVSRRIEKALEKAGLKSFQYGIVKGRGIALVTSVYCFNDKGESKFNEQEYCNFTQVNPGFTYFDWGALLTNSTRVHGNQRYFIFLLGPVLNDNGVKPNIDQMTSLKTRAGLGHAIESQPWTIDDRCTVFVYEFEDNSVKNKYVFLDKNTNIFSAQEHLEKSGIINYLD